jgi:single-strand DNA-binding protein
MRGVNKVIILGTVGKDPEIRSISNGNNTVCSFSMATSEAWKDKQTGQLVENTEWHNVKCFGKTAEIIGNYVRKGSKLYIEGKIKTEKWQDKTTGQDKYSTYILADIVQLLDSKKDGQSTGQQSNQQHGAYRGNQQSQNLDDDLPF